MNSCVLKQFFLERVEQPKISPKNPGNALTNFMFSKICGDAATKKRGCN